MTFDEETESNTEKEDSNWVYAENSQEKEDLTEATSKEQEGENTQTESGPLLSLVSPDLKSEAKSLSVNVSWLKNRVTTLRDLKKAGPSIYASLSLLCELRVKENSYINKVKETKLALQVCVTSITQFQESINRLQVELTSHQEASSDLQAQLEGVIVE
nr:hypothetical protein CFP56_45112 [Quercus suber]